MGAVVREQRLEMERVIEERVSEAYSLGLIQGEAQGFAGAINILNVYVEAARARAFVWESMVRQVETVHA